MRRALVWVLAICLVATAPSVLAELPADWDDLRQEREGLEDTSAEVRSSHERELAELFQLNRTLQQIEAEVSRLEVESQHVEADRAVVAAEGSRLREELEVRQARFGARARYFYEKGNMGLLQMLLGATDLGDFISRVDLLTLILRRDRELIQEVRALRAEVQQHEAHLNRLADELRVLRSQEQARRDELAAQVERKEQALAALADRRVEVERELARLEEIWAREAMPILTGFTTSFAAHSVHMVDIQPDALQVTLFPPGATMRLSEETLNAFLDRSEELKGLRFRIAPSNVALVGRFSGVEMEINGRVEIVGKTAFRYRPTGIQFYGFTVSEQFLEELVGTGRLDVDLEELISPLTLLEVRAEDGYLFGRAGVK